MVFSGIETLFFICGIITILFAGLFLHYNKKYKFNVWSWLTLIAGAFLFVFCLAWAVSSVLEGVPRAASMGLVFFGIPSVILLLVGRRLVLKKK